MSPRASCLDDALLDYMEQAADALVDVCERWRLAGSAEIVEKHTGHAYVVRGAYSRQRMSPLPPAFPHQSSNAIAEYGGGCLSNSKSHLAFARWDCGFHQIKTAHML